MLGSMEPVRVPSGIGPVAVHVLGAGRPTLLWHDVAVDGSSWGYAIRALLPGRRLLIVDGPGWGRSTATRARPTEQGVVDAALAVIDSLAPGSAVDWVGNGWGGRVGLGAAWTRPAAVRSLVLAAVDPGRMPGPERARLRRTVRGLRLLGPVGPIGRAIVADRLAPDSRTEPQTVGAVLDALLLAGRFRAAASIARTDLRRPDLRALLPLVTAPTLMVAGGASSAWTPDDARGAAALSPFARVAVIPGASRLIPLDRPAELVTAIHAFWSTLDAG